MPNIIVSSTEQNQGLIVFAHRELSLLKRWNFIINRWKTINNYQVAVHFGWWHPESPSLPSSVDFVLGSTSTVNYTDITQLDFCSRDFLNRGTEAWATEQKVWDVINISNAHENKRLDLYLDDVELGIKKGIKFCLLMQVPDRPRFKSYQDRVVKRAYQLSHHEYFDFYPIKMREGSLVGSSRSTALSTLAKSRVLAHYTSVEGESRIITEALTLGLAVVADNGLKGGGLDMLTNSNSRLWKQPNESLICIEEALRLRPQPKGFNRHNEFRQVLISRLGDFNTMVEQDLDFILPVQIPSPLNLSINMKFRVLDYV